MKKFSLLSLLTLVSISAFAQAGVRYRVAREIYENPSILAEPWFWGVVGFIVLCVIIYYVCKDKE